MADQSFDDVCKQVTQALEERDLSSLPAFAGFLQSVPILNDADEQDRKALGKQGLSSLPGFVKFLRNMPAEQAPVANQLFADLIRSCVSPHMPTQGKVETPNFGKTRRDVTDFLGRQGYFTVNPHDEGEGTEEYKVKEQIDAFKAIVDEVVNPLLSEKSGMVTLST